MPNPTFQGFQNKGLILQLNEATLLRSHVFMKRKKEKKEGKKRKEKKRRMEVKQLTGCWVAEGC